MKIKKVQFVYTGMPCNVAVNVHFKWTALLKRLSFGIALDHSNSF